MQPTSPRAHAANSIAIHSDGSTGPGGASPRRNAYATTLRTNIERLIPLEMMQVRRAEVAHRFATVERSAPTRRSADANNNALDTHNANNIGSAASMSGGLTRTAPSGSAVQTQRSARSAPEDIDLLCAVASRDLVAHTVADIRTPGVWNEHLLDVLLALKRKQPDLLGASNLRVVASNQIPGHMALFTHSQRANHVQDPVDITTLRGPASGIASASASAAGPASGLANNAPGDPRVHAPANTASGHLSFVHDAQHYHIVNTKEAFFRAVIAVRENMDPLAVSKQNIDALIEDTADFLEDHWREHYRVVWTKMAKSGAA